MPYALLLLALLWSSRPCDAAELTPLEAKVEAFGGIDALDPLNRNAASYQALRKLIGGPEDALAIVNMLWIQYNATRNPKYGDWALQYGYLWWQALPPGKPRVEAAVVGQKLARKFSADHPEHPAGHFWHALFYGSEGIARGVLNALNMLPTFLAILEKVEEKAPNYFFGTVSLIKAKMYIKLPPFPLSFGDVDKGLELIEQGRSLQESTMALWHINRAEAEMLKNGPAAALAALDGIEKICATNLNAAYNYQMGRYLADRFREAIRNGTYNKYTWDPLLESIAELSTREYPPPSGCKAQGD